MRTDRYRRAADAIHVLLRRFAPGGVVEKASYDDFYLDVTDAVEVASPCSAVACTKVEAVAAAAAAATDVTDAVEAASQAEAGYSAVEAAVATPAAAREAGTADACAALGYHGLQASKDPPRGVWLAEPWPQHLQHHRRRGDGSGRAAAEIARSPIRSAGLSDCSSDGGGGLDGGSDVDASDSGSEGCGSDDVGTIEGNSGGPKSDLAVAAAGTGSRGARLFQPKRQSPHPPSPAQGLVAPGAVAYGPRGVASAPQEVGSSAHAGSSCAPQRGPVASPPWAWRDVCCRLRRAVSVALKLGAELAEAMPGVTASVGRSQTPTDTTMLDATPADP
eukprot:363770-Chlamydomonas_euryale.AAC.3